MKLLWFFFRPYKLQCLGVLALTFIAGLLEAANLAALYPIINYGLNLGTKNSFLQHFEQAADRIAPGNPFLAACLALIAISILTALFKLVYNHSSYKLMIKISGDMQKEIFDKFNSAEYDFYVKNQQGKLLYAGTMAPFQTTSCICSTVLLGNAIINAVFLFVLLVVLSWQATMLIVVVGAMYGTVVKKVRQSFVNKCSLASTEENQRKNVILNEFINGIKTIKIFLAAGEWKKRYTECVERGLISDFRMLVAMNFPETFVKLLFYLIIALTGVVFSRMPHQELILLLPMLGTFVLAVNRFLPSIYVIGTTILKISQCMPSIEIVHELCSREFPDEVDGGKELARFNDRITFENVGFKYDSMADHLLKDLSFAIERRKMTALVGLSGSGKTTIINLLLRLYRPKQGAVKIDGQDIRDLSAKSYLSKIGYVSQETFIFNNTFKENIRFGMQNCTDAMIEEAAKLANAHDFIMDTPKGYESVVGDSGIKLSGGQRQRVAIARALLRHPEIIIFDEATSSLDNISEKKIQKAINNISKHTTVLVIAHRLSTVQNADKIIILQKGQIMEQGTHEELLKNKNLYYDLHMSREAESGELTDEKVEL